MCGCTAGSEPNRFCVNACFCTCGAPGGASRLP
jgi:hypothetical protein